jgi:uncharacterized protein
MIPDFTQHIALLTICLFIPASQSLKDKRMVLKSIKDKIHNQFNVSVAELDGQDKWQVSTLGIVMIGSDQRYMDGGLQKILSFVGSYPEIEITDHQIEFI